MRRAFAVSCCFGSFLFNLFTAAEGLSHHIMHLNRRLGVKYRLCFLSGNRKSNLLLVVADPISCRDCPTPKDSYAFDENARWVRCLGASDRVSNQIYDDRLSFDGTLLKHWISEPLPRSTLNWVHVRRDNGNERPRAHDGPELGHARRLARPPMRPRRRRR